MKQKDHFLNSEGDAWFARNRNALQNRKLPDEDSILLEILNLPPPVTFNRYNVLEVGCSDGYRLEWLQKNMGWQCSGIDPSPNAIEQARKRGLDVHLGTADQLAFSASSFDMLIFASCLYLCDRDDLFRIAEEADRVLCNRGWLIIHEFFSMFPVSNEYHHLPGLFSYKMDYRKLFTWHPHYICYSHKVYQQKTQSYVDDPQEWVATSVLRKLAR